MGVEDIEALEALYQGSLASSINALAADFNVRYPSRAGELMNEALRVFRLNTDDKAKVRRSTADKLERHVKGLIGLRGCSLDMVKPLAVIWYYVGGAESEARIRAMMELAGYQISINEYIRCGLLMHIDESTLVIPEYLAGMLNSVEPPSPIDVGSLIYSNSQNVQYMVVLESLLRGIKPIDRYLKAFYGVTVNEALSKGLLKPLYTITSEGIVANPLVNVNEAKAHLRRVKDTRARVIRQALMLYGRYRFDRSLYCGVNAMFTGSARGLMVYLCPWTPHFIKLIRRRLGPRALITVNASFRDDIIEFLLSFKDRLASLERVMYALVDLSSMSIDAVYQSSSARYFDDVLDVLYESGLRVIEHRY